MAILNGAANAAFTNGICGSLLVLVSGLFTFVLGILYPDRRVIIAAQLHNTLAEE